MENPIKAIYKWQVEAGLADRPYDDFLESSFQIEEALEGFDNEAVGVLQQAMEDKSPEFSQTPSYVYSPKLASRAVMLYIEDKSKPLSDVDRFDKAIDAIVFAIGSMAKLGLTPQQIQKGILVVNQANMQKLGMPVDEHGKKIKPEGFVGPEEQLQKILSERK